MLDDYAPSDENCVVWLEPFEDSSGSGVRVKQRCDRNAVKVVRVMYNGTLGVCTPYEPWGYQVMACDGENLTPGGVCEWYSYSSSFKETTLCTGELIRYDYQGNNWHWLKGSVDPCPFWISYDSYDCAANDVVVAEFIVEPCRNLLTGDMEPCLRNCQDPLQAALEGGGAPETCSNGIDDNCNGSIDEDCGGDGEGEDGSGGGGGNGGGGDDGGCDSVEWHKDYDDDRYSDGTPATSCERPYGYKLASELIQTSGDCDDNDYITYPGAEEVCDGKDNNCDGVKDEGCCEGWIDASPNEVRPQNTGGSVKANVIIGLNKPAPPKGCNVSLVVEPEKNSGGHKHDDKRPKGTLSKDAILFGEGKTDTESLTYTSSAISGIEKIKAEFKESKKSEKAAEIAITVKVPWLQAFPSSGAHWSVSRNGTATHPEGTHGISTSVAMLKKVAGYYFERTKRKLSVNDLSLPMGGLYDYNNTWASPHSTHKTGTDADINRTDGGGVFKNCWQDYDLKRAVAKTSDGRAFPRLICEDAKHRPVPLDDPTGLYKHIDFD